MKNITKAIIYLQVTALCLTAALAGPGGSAKELPFKGTVEQVETQSIDFPTMLVKGTGTGNATKLGRYTETYEHKVDLLSGEGIGSAQFNAANGDSILTVIVALGVPTDVQGVFIVTEHHTIIGGTGRFEGSTGSFTLVRLINELHISHGSFDGTISR